MVTFLTIVHLLIAICLIVVVLIQSGKGAGIGAMFGGGAGQTLFGSSGGKTFFIKLTTSLGIAFMACSLLLASLGSRPKESNLIRAAKQDLENSAKQAQPASQTTVTPMPAAQPSAAPDTKPAQPANK